MMDVNVNGQDDLFNNVQDNNGLNHLNSLKKKTKMPNFFSSFFKNKQQFLEHMPWRSISNSKV